MLKGVEKEILMLVGAWWRFDLGRDSMWRWVLFGERGDEVA